MVRPECCVVQIPAGSGESGKALCPLLPTPTVRQIPMIKGQNHAVLCALALILAAAGGLGWWRWHEDAPKRTALQATEQFAQALFARDSEALLQAVALPIALQDRTAPEQAEFLVNLTLSFLPPLSAPTDAYSQQRQKEPP